MMAPADKCCLKHRQIHKCSIRIRSGYWKVAGKPCLLLLSPTLDDHLCLVDRKTETFSAIWDETESKLTFLMHSACNWRTCSVASHDRYEFVITPDGDVEVYWHKCEVHVTIAAARSEIKLAKTRSPCRGGHYTYFPKYQTVALNFHHSQTRDTQLEYRTDVFSNSRT